MITGQEILYNISKVDNPFSYQPSPEPPFPKHPNPAPSPAPTGLPPNPDSSGSERSSKWIDPFSLALGMFATLIFAALLVLIYYLSKHVKISRFCKRLRYSSGVRSMSLPLGDMSHASRLCPRCRHPYQPAASNSTCGASAHNGSAAVSIDPHSMQEASFNTQSQSRVGRSAAARGARELGARRRGAGALELCPGVPRQRSRPQERERCRRDRHAPRARAPAARRRGAAERRLGLELRRVAPRRAREPAAARARALRHRVPGALQRGGGRRGGPAVALGGGRVGLGVRVRVDLAERLVEPDADGPDAERVGGRRRQGVPRRGGVPGGALDPRPPGDAAREHRAAARLLPARAAGAGRAARRECDAQRAVARVPVLRARQPVRPPAEAGGHADARGAAARRARHRRGPRVPARGARAAQGVHHRIATSRVRTCCCATTSAPASLTSGSPIASRTPTAGPRRCSRCARARLPSPPPPPLPSPPLPCPPLPSFSAGKLLCLQYYCLRYDAERNAPRTGRGRAPSRFTVLYISTRSALDDPRVRAALSKLFSPPLPSSLPLPLWVPLLVERRKFKSRCLRSVSVLFRFDPSSRRLSPVAADLRFACDVLWCDFTMLWWCGIVTPIRSPFATHNSTCYLLFAYAILSYLFPTMTMYTCIIILRTRTAILYILVPIRIPILNCDFCRSLRCALHYVYEVPSAVHVNYYTYE